MEQLLSEKEAPAAPTAGTAAEEGGGQRKLLVIYRTFSRNHIALSAIADRKANFLLSVNTILCSVAFTFLVAKGQEEPLYVVPGILLIAVSLVTIVFAIISTTPHIGKGHFTREQVAARKTNLLFFGNFYRMNPEEHLRAFSEMMDDKKFLKQAIAADMYHLGVVLAKKYRYLRLSYLVFLIGSILSIIGGYVAFELHITWFTTIF